jgi:hypothetical protein
MGRIENFLDKHFKFQLIKGGCEGNGDVEVDGQTGEGEIFLKRWFIWNDNKGGEGGKKHKAHIYLHKFCRSDADKELHDHPWDFLSLILKNGYIEETVDGLERIKAGRLLLRWAEHRHRVHIDESRPSWSLVFTTKKYRDWGFWTEKDGWVFWETFVADKCKELLKKVVQISGASQPLQPIQGYSDARLSRNVD